LEKRGLIKKEIKGGRIYHYPTEYGEFLEMEFDERFDKIYNEMKKLIDEFAKRFEEYSKH